MHEIAARTQIAELATGSEDVAARRWETKTGTQSGPPMAHENWVRAVALSADGSLLATGSDGSLLWGTVTGSLRHVEPLPGDPEELLEEWQRRLGLAIDEDWRIVPSNR